MEDFSQLITKKEIDGGHQKDGKDMLVCFARKKLIQVQPEEIIRQKVIRFLVDDSLPFFYTSKTQNSTLLSLT